MRESPANAAFSAASIFLALLAAAAVAAAVVLGAIPGLLNRLHGLADNPWWLRYREQGSGAASQALWRIGAGAAAALVSIAAAHRLRAIHRRESSPVLPFLMVFLFSLGLECLRAGTAVLFAADGPISISVLLTRVIYWARFVGMLGLLAASLYCTDMKYRAFFLLAGAVFLVSFAMAAYIPVDGTMFLAQLTWKLGDEQSVWFVNLAIGSLTILTGTAAAFMRRGRRFVMLAVAIAILVGSREVEFFAVAPAPLAAGVIAQTAGAILCMRAFTAPGR